MQSHSKTERQKEIRVTEYNEHLEPMATYERMTKLVTYFSDE